MYPIRMTLGADLYPFYQDDKGNVFSNVTAVFDCIYGAVADAANGTTAVRGFRIGVVIAAKAAA
jgi:hypothetical protein